MKLRSVALPALCLPAMAGLLAFLAAPVAIAPRALAQGVPGQGSDPQEEIKDLFRKVEKDLEEINKLLNEASRTASGSSAADSAASDTGSATEAHRKQRGVVDSIQKILDLIPESGGGGGT